ncbi:MAG: twin-arginine translocase subunit TatC [Pyrinomonadaceae bacterium]|nr:twin-arginine translocase subunit TatC [Pyrinomonadaceae bacterium]
MKAEEAEEISGQMSFLEHLDELRRRIVNSLIILVIAFCFCWYFSGSIYNFLSIPVRQALSEAKRREVPIEVLTGSEKVVAVTELNEGETVKYVFDKATKFGSSVVAAGTSVNAVVVNDATGKKGLFTNEPVVVSNVVIPKGVRLPADLLMAENNNTNSEESLVVTTATEPFTLYVTVSLYAAVALALPFLLFQVWGFISPALYKHERAYVTPFILLSSISFVGGAAFAYYILFPPAVRYLLGVGSDFSLMLKATEYFDFITIIMLAMGLIFQMPAITYVLARIGIVNALFLTKSWKYAIVVILFVAAVVSPTADIPNMMLFAAPMMILYVISIFIAWFFGKKRQKEEEIEA